MAYVALYRKYRPNTFESIVGQENITKILRNQVKNDKISHAYIFSGSRGTGKTSAAKVFARAINCLNPKDGEPCNECSVCKSILDASTTDVIEMDAASNNSVENIRQIRQEVVYATMDVKYRVYIIDEAHMLTTSAFNALLKTLEEPPKNVIFILATTEQHKIPVTILSRCLRFEFNKISQEDIKKRVEYVLKDLKVDYEDSAVKYIAKIADGALRDALSILDRCLSENQEKLVLSDVQNIVGAIDQELFNSLVDSIDKFDTIGALKSIDNIVNKGKDLRELSYRLTEYFLEALINCEVSNEKQRYQQIIEKLSKLDSDIRNSSMPLVVLKSGIVEICKFTSLDKEINVQIKSVEAIENKSELAKKIQVLEDRILDLTKKLENATFIESNIKEKNKLVENKQEEKVNEKVEKVKVKKEEKSDETTNEIGEIVDFKIFEFAQDFKKEFLNRGKTKIYSTLVNADIYINDRNVKITTENNFSHNLLKTEEAISSMSTVLKENFGIDLPLKVELSSGGIGKPISKLEAHFKDNNIEYTQID